MTRARLLALALALVSAGCVELRTYEEVVRELPPEELVEVDGRRVHVVDRGEGEAVVLLHGFGASTYSWRRVQPALAERFRTLAIDLSGFGYTERPRDFGAYTAPGQIEAILAVLDRSGIERAHVVGHSYGGALAMHLGRLHPDRVRSLVLVSSAGPEYPRYRRYPLARIQPLVWLYARTLGLRRGRVVRGLERSVEDDALVTPELVEEYWARLKIEGTVRAYRGLSVPQPEREARWFDVAELELPTLVVWGEEDPLIPVADGREAARRMPNSRFLAYDGIGHLPPEEMPGELAERMLEFLADPGAVLIPAASSEPPGG